jgi:hypothetical protein
MELVWGYVGQEREREERCDHSETKRDTPCRIIRLRQQQEIAPELCSGHKVKLADPHLTFKALYGHMTAKDYRLAADFAVMH